MAHDTIGYFNYLDNSNAASEDQIWFIIFLEEFSDSVLKQKAGKRVTEKVLLYHCI